MADQVDSTRATPAAGATRATSGPDEWPAQAADTIVRVVGSVRDKTTGPAVTAARGAVYGLLAAILATTALVLASVLAVRALAIGVDALLGLGDADKAGRSVWIAHALVGLAMTLAGLWAWRKARHTPAH
jgi:succinate dehydrogenase/fumarate reductase cytochrome b subunit